MASLDNDVSQNVISETNMKSFEQGEKEHLPKQSRQVVIVDDESTGRTILAKIVQQVADDLTVVEFDNPKDVLVWLESNHPSLIITDFRMPD
ncbi:MAG: response regulator, partial [Gammaproteobacteria bacterium]|nr:response regulator [Gammaproteobacteria bacterium]